MKAGIVVFALSLLALLGLLIYHFTAKPAAMSVSAQTVVLSDSTSVPVTADTLYEPAVVENAKELPHKTEIIMEMVKGTMTPVMCVSWVKVPEAIRYDIYSSSNPDGPYRKESETKALSLKINLGGQVKQKYYKIKSVVREVVNENR